MNPSIAFVSAAIIVGVAGCGAAQARPSQDQQMLKLSPETRLEQRCNARAMGVANREHKNFRADEFVAYAFADPVIKGDTVRAPGGAIRNGNAWYRFSYICETADQGLAIKSFSYQLGGTVPRSDWDAHFLVPR